MTIEHADAVTILLVDDDSVDVRAVTRALRKHGVDNPIETAGNGIEALDIIRGTNERTTLQRPYLVLLDVNMPRMNGIEFLETVRQDPDLTSMVIFVLTTSDDDRDRVAAYSHHVAGYILKSEAGRDFINLVSMLEKFVLTVRLPNA